MRIFKRFDGTKQRNVSELINKLINMLKLVSFTALAL